MNPTPPKDSRDPNWRGPLNKLQLKLECYYFIECLDSATCIDDIEAMLASPEWKAFYLQAAHDFPALLQVEDRSLMEYLEKKQREFL